VITTRTPLRISLGGGGTDLPSYYQEFGGFVISAAINKYVYISINRHFFPGYHLRYSVTETPSCREEIKHPLIREALTVCEVDEPLEIVSMADVPAGTGLGSSGSFLVGLINALQAHARRKVTAECLARTAVEIEMNRLNEPVGKQDQYVAAYGGLLCQEYRSDDSVSVHWLNMSDSAIHELRDSLMLFFVGTTRSASSILGDQKAKSEQRNQAMIDNLHFTKQLGGEIKTVLQDGDFKRFGELMHEHWLRKRGRSAGMSSSHIDALYECARTKGGATGGKLVGAGGSGFLLFHTEDRRRLRKTMCEGHGLSEMDFSFDYEGSQVTLRNRG
jgi:D-glycero-alpha-D-manno-heptose-7-phosphate kinase